MMNRYYNVKNLLMRAALALVSVMATAAAWADQDGSWTYQPNADGQRCVITGYTGATDVKGLYIPMQLNGLWVVSINDNVLSKCINLERLTFYEDARIEDMPNVQNPKFKLVVLRSVDLLIDCLPASITNIYNAFSGSGIKKIGMPSVTSMGNRAFQGCDSLSWVIFGKAATIGDYAFSNLSQACTVNYPGKMENWNYRNYQYSPNLVVNCSDGSRGWCGDEWSDGMELYKDASCLLWTLDNDGHLDIDCIVWDDFFENYGPKQIIKSNCWNIRKVKTLTLSHVYDLDGREFDSDDGHVVTGEFEAYPNLTNVVVNEGLVRVGDRAFYDCPSLQTVSLPSSVTYIGKWSFYLCSSLADIYFNGTETQWENVEKARDWNNGTPETMKIHWRCAVTFDANGHGTAPAAQTNLWSNEAKATEPAQPTAEGWMFTGWYTDAECTKKWNFDDIVPGDLTLYAKWSLPCDVTASAEETSIDIPYGQEWTDISVSLNSLNLGWFQNEGGTVRVADAVALTPFVGSGAGSDIQFTKLGGGDRFNAKRGAGEHVVGNRVTEAMTATGETGKIWVYIPKETWKSAAPGDYVHSLSFDAVFYSNSESPTESYVYSLGSDARVMLWVTIPENSIATGGEQVHSSKFIVHSDEWFTIDGRKLNGQPKAKGVYIRNGKKVVRAHP
jgi:uncharacterized repeat protein (TIGR02543 family)